jgi:hypothetical protein
MSAVLPDVRAAKTDRPDLAVAKGEHQNMRQIVQKAVADEPRFTVVVSGVHHGLPQIQIGRPGK